MSGLAQGVREASSELEGVAWRNMQAQVQVGPLPAPGSL